MRAKLYFLFVAALVAPIASVATIHVITQTGLTFSPAQLNVSVNDTIRWVWASGSHTTTSRAIPNGAATWDNPLTSGNASFQYKVTVAGVYNYVCVPHESMGMVGSFTASPATSVIENLKLQFEIYPNPASAYLNVNFNPSEMPTQLNITNLIGERVFAQSYSKSIEQGYSKEFDLTTIPSGIYLVTIYFENGKRQTRKLMVNK
jgi:plastocyanin